MIIVLGQINPTVGELDGNTKLILDCLRKASEAGADLALLPELAVTGYPPEDLIQKPSFLRDAEAALMKIARHAPPITACIGFPRLRGGAARNSAAVLHGSRVIDVYDKVTLPNYSVFDEKRYFRPGLRCPVYRWGSWRVALNICEDLWTADGVPRVQADAGKARLMVNLSASPYHTGKGEIRETLVRRRAMQSGAYVVYVNQVGGQDDLVFDGRSLVASPSGEIVARARAFEEDLLRVELPADPPTALPRDDLPGAEPPSEGIPLIEARLELDVGEWPGSPGNGAAAANRVEPAPVDLEEDYRALLLGLGDYVRKNGFGSVVLGLSGGIDSALTATLAADALGPTAVTGLAMPSEYSSPESLDDARELANRLGIRLDCLPIAETFRAFRAALEEPFRGLSENVAEENLQARIRGALLMAYSNKFGSLVLATGNKSELAVGYCTLYGDMVGGYAVLKDVLKTRVYALARWRNRQGPGDGPIPTHTLERPPSAELRPQQTDQDTLPPYDVLDGILERIVEREASPEDVVAEGFDPEDVSKVCNWINASEYKRRQAPPGVRLTTRAFGKDRRYPVTNRYRPCRPGE